MIFIISFDDFKRILNKILRDQTEEVFRHPIFYHETPEMLTLYVTMGDYIVYCTQLSKDIIPNLESFKLEFLPKVRTIELLEPLKDQKDIQINITQV